MPLGILDSLLCEHSHFSFQLSWSIIPTVLVLFHVAFYKHLPHSGFPSWPHFCPYQTMTLVSATLALYKNTPHSLITQLFSCSWLYSSLTLEIAINHFLLCCPRLIYAGSQWHSTDVRKKHFEFIEFLKQNLCPSIPTWFWKTVISVIIEKFL